MVRDAAVWVRPERDEDGFLPEGPQAVTLGGRAAVLWVNIQTAPDATAGTLFARFWDTGEVRRFPSPDQPGFVRAADEPDAFFVGAGKRVWRFRPLAGAAEPLATIPDPEPRTIINDGTRLPDGRLLFGTKDVKFANPLAHLYLFDPATTAVTMLLGGMTCSNGKVVRPEGTGYVVWDIDTPRKAVTRYTLSGDRLTEEGVALDLRAEAGSPDGMCDAGDGTAVIAFYNPDPAPFGRAVRFDLATGERLDEWRTPGSPRVTCPLLVDRPDGRKLILTTATEGMPADQRARCPAAGCLFVADA